MELTNKTIVLTGGTSGIGRSMVKKLSSENQVIVISRDAEKLKKLAQEHPNVKTFQCDLADLARVDDVCANLLSEFPRVDILINNAAIQNTPEFLSPAFRREKIAEEVNINFTSICHIIHALLPAMLAVEGRSIVLNVNSALALFPKTGSAVYCATKGGLNILSQSLAYQFEKTNIRVLQAILPIVDTPMTFGRGRGKISAESAADAILLGILKEVPEHFIGKSKALKIVARLSPTVARLILKGG